MDFLDVLLEVLKAARGIDFSGYRREVIERRVSVRMDELGLADREAYVGLLRTDPSECDRLVDTIAINVSSFFRDPIVFEILAQSLLPHVIDRKKRIGTSEIRVWSAGCASGEEAYSAAILLRRALEDRAKARAFEKREEERWSTYVFATDIDESSLEKAGAARYSREQLLTTRLGILDEFFIPTGSDYQVCPEVRDMVRFSYDDLTSSGTIAPADSVFGSFDLVLCRNVLIYFDLNLQNLVCEKLHASLVNGAYLILGNSESIGMQVEGEFKVVDRRNRIYQKRF